MARPFQDQNLPAPMPVLAVTEVMMHYLMNHEKHEIVSGRLIYCMNSLGVVVCNGDQFCKARAFAERSPTMFNRKAMFAVAAVRVRSLRWESGNRRGGTGVCVPVISLCATSMKNLWLSIPDVCHVVNNFIGDYTSHNPGGG